MTSSQLKEHNQKPSQEDNNPLIDDVDKMKNDDNIILQRNLNGFSKYCLCCSECNPSWAIYQTLGNREPNYKKQYFSLQPTKNNCCQYFETEINQTNDQDYIRSIRTKMGLFGWLPCCDGPELKCPVRNFMDAVNTAGSKALFFKQIQLNTVIKQYNFNNIFLKGFGNINKCCEYESQSWEDIWDSGKQLRLGRIVYIKRMRQVGCCWCCWGIPEYWKKLEFPDRATPEERALMIAAVANKSGECCCCLQPTACCNPY